MKRCECVVWDWNGTLLDDVDANIKTINILLERRALPTIKSREEYTARFRFPVIDYYRELGFDVLRENFEDVAAEYVEVYNAVAESAPLAQGVTNVISKLAALGVKQVIISAAEGERLRREVAARGIENNFDAVLGMGDNRGDGKSALAREFVASSGISPEKILFVGDMAHDREVSAACGCPCLLVSSGHSSHERLLKESCEVGKTVADVLALFCSEELV